jgi:predicted AAA+ superfamily ATPase
MIFFMKTYIHRNIEKELLRLKGQFPVILLTGPRQTGKSTLLARLFPRYQYLSFDDSSLRLAAKRDPALFVETLRKPVIIDEIQYAPEILPYIKIDIDRKRENGRFMLTGSQIFNLMAGLSESLAGRTALFELLPFSFEELESAQKRKSPRGRMPWYSPLGCYRQILRGFYPVPNTEHTDTSAFYGAYLSLYIERDLRQIQNIKDITAFETFLQILAGRAGGLLNISDLARDCGLSHATAKNWLSILESSRIIYLLRPWSRNVSKRLVKSPKLYFTDTGLLCYLLKYPNAETLLAGPASGAVFENMIVMEFLKNKLNRGLRGDLYFYRDSNGVEIDLLIDEGASVSLWEIKAAKTIKAEMAKPLGQAPFKDAKKHILSLYETPLPVSPGVQALPWWTKITGNR